MLAYEEALQRLLALASVLPAESVPLADARGRVLTEALYGTEPMPAFDHSAMDGYAVRTADFVGEGPWRLPVVGESRTGRVPGPLAAGAASRIFTGAELPAGADAVVMQENVERAGEVARFAAPPAPGDHVRRAGEDLSVGQLALAAGERLGPAQLGLLAALDRGRVQVTRRPRVHVVATGDELRPPGSPRRPGSIPESNSFAVAAMAEQAGAEVRVLGASTDDAAQTTRRIREGLEGCDVFVTTGGVSVGDYDLVRPALEAAGAQIEFWKVAIKPGKPLVVGRAGHAIVLGLPGNPASAQVTFGLFGLPLLRSLEGARRVLPPLEHARVGEALGHKPGRLGCYRARLEDGVATPLTGQASGAVTSMAWADALILVPADSAGLPAGAQVRVLRLRDL